MGRNEVGVGDEGFLTSMIPHHSRAILVCQEATITDPEIEQLCSEIVEAQEREIAQMKAQIGMMKPMFAGMRITVEVKSASGIASTNASHPNGDAITYMDVEMDKLLNNVEAFGEIMESGEGSMSMADAAKKFKGIEGLKIEGQKTVTIELK